MKKKFFSSSELSELESLEVLGGYDPQDSSNLGCAVNDGCVVNPACHPNSACSNATCLNANCTQENCVVQLDCFQTGRGCLSNDTCV